MNRFAQDLRAYREAHGTTLKDISTETRINLKYLHAIEEGNFTVLPQTYLRAFIRSYAKSVGLNPDDVIKCYERALTGKYVSGEITTPRKAPPQREELLKIPPIQQPVVRQEEPIVEHLPQKDEKVQFRLRNEIESPLHQETQKRDALEHVPHNGKGHTAVFDEVSPAFEQTTPVADEQTSTIEESPTTEQSATVEQQQSIVETDEASPQHVEGDSRKTPSLWNEWKRVIVETGILIAIITVTSVFIFNTNDTAKPKDSSGTKAKQITERPFEQVVKETEERYNPPKKDTIATTTLIPAVNPGSLPAVSDSLSLEVITTATTWLYAIIDGKKTMRMDLTPNLKYELRAKQKFAVTVGNAGAMQFALAGQTFSALGKAKEKKTFMLSNDGIHEVKPRPKETKPIDLKPIDIRPIEQRP
jgi:cytoskeletal protein RodZ